MRRSMLALAAVFLFAACGGGSTPPPPKPEPAAFDLAAVKAKFVADCNDNVNVGTWFCDPVDLDEMTADGTILNVPTEIDPNAETARGDGELICGWFANSHVASDGSDLGYETIGILDKSAGNLAACTAL